MSNPKSYEELLKENEAQKHEIQQLKEKLESATQELNSVKGKSEAWQGLAEIGAVLSARRQGF